jgi:Rrf2 family protein
MRMSEGVEWAAHVCVLLHWAETAGEAPVPAGRLAEAYDLPGPYLVKQLQALGRAGLTESMPGRRGGVRLARPGARITLMDVVTAIEGPDDAFACTEIRRHGMNADRPARDFAQTCGVAHAMRQAELAWRRSLASTSIAELADSTPAGRARDARRFLARH